MWQEREMPRAGSMHSPAHMNVPPILTWQEAGPAANSTRHAEEERICFGGFIY